MLEHDAKQIVAMRGLCVPRSARLAWGADPAELLDVATQLGFPLVMKVHDPRFVHKTDVGGVRVGIASPAALIAAREEIAAAIARTGAAPPAELLIEEHRFGSCELLVGVTRDEAFGCVMAFGLGGILTEALADPLCLLPPLDRDEVERALRAVPWLLTLERRLGLPRLHERIVDVLLHFGGEDGLWRRTLDDWVALEANPILVTGRDLVFLDVRVIEATAPMLVPT